MTTTTSIIVVRHHLSLWSFVPSKQRVQLGDVAMVGVGDGGWLWFCQLTGGLLTFWLHSLLPHFPAIVIIMVAAADGIDGMRRFRLHGTSGGYR